MALRTGQKIFLGVGAAAAVAFCIALAVGLSDAFADRDQTAVAAVATAHVEPILGPRVFNGLGGDIAPDFGVTAAGAQPPAVALSVGGVLRVVENLDSLPRTRKVTIAASQPDSFALDTDGTMLAVADGYLGVLDEHGVVAHSVPLSTSGTSAHVTAALRLPVPGRSMQCAEPAVVSSSCTIASPFVPT